MSEFLGWVALALTALMIGGCFILLIAEDARRNAECNAKGGVRIQSQCIKAEVIE